MSQWQRILIKRTLKGPPIGGKPSVDALLSAESALALLQVTGDEPSGGTAGDLDACAGERAPHNQSIMLPVSQRVQPGVFFLPRVPLPAHRRRSRSKT